MSFDQYVSKVEHCNKQTKIYHRNYAYTKYTMQFSQALNKLKSFNGKVCAVNWENFVLKKTELNYSLFE